MHRAPNSQKRRFPARAGWLSAAEIANDRDAALFAFALQRAQADYLGISVDDVQIGVMSTIGSTTPGCGGDAGSGRRRVQTQTRTLSVQLRSPAAAAAALPDVEAFTDRCSTAAAFSV